MNLKGVNLYLIGMMGSGKTTIGRLLAKELSYHFFDTDALIEQVGGQSIPQIFAETGEPGFRQLETQVLAELSAYKNLAIATGGGIVLNRINWSYLRHGIVIWLDVAVEQLYTRLQQDATPRPLLIDTDPLTKLRMLVEQRQRLYAQADVQVTIAENVTSEQVVVQVLQAVSQILKPDVLGSS